MNRLCEARAPGALALLALAALCATTLASIDVGTGQDATVMRDHTTTAPGDRALGAAGISAASLHDQAHPTAGAAGTSAASLQERASHAPDSIDLLLLGTPRTSAILADGRGLRIDALDGAGERTSGALEPTGIASADRRARGIDVRADRSDVVIAGARHHAVRITGSGEITLASGERRRVVRGSLTVRAVGGGLVVVARLARAEYLAGTLCSEASLSDPGAYLVALSVLQRNYVVTHRGRHAPEADLCDNTHCQLFNAASIGARAHAIVREAAAIGLGAEGSAAPCYYSASCGGSSLTPADVWGRNEPGYAPVRCDECRSDRWRRWSRTVPATAQARAVLAGAPPAPFVDDDFKIRVGRALGFNTLPSNTVDRLERRGSHYVISGRGFGHRVGLCQAGARQLARHGRDAAAILARYFPTAKLNRVTDGSSHRP